MNSYEQRTRDMKAQKALSRLESLPGMLTLKTQIEQSIQFAKVSKLREQNGLKTKAHTNHMIFTGNPGTGKTTAARLIGQAFAALGLLKSSGEEIPFVEVHNNDIAHPHVGESEIRIKRKFEEAQGGVLFIDEAYSFLSRSDHKTGEKIIAVIVQNLEDLRDTVLVIAAGYPDEMENFLNFNPGLRSRFSNVIHFPDYNTDDMLRIATFICNEMQYKMTDEFSTRLAVRLDQEKKRPGFGNARTVRNILEQSIKRQSVRLSKMPNRPGREELITLTSEDISVDVQKTTPSEKDVLTRALYEIQNRLQDIEIEEMLS